MTDSRPKGSDAILTPANIVTLVRICLVPVFVAVLISPWPEWIGYDWLDQWKSWIAAAVFVIISCTDWLDGYLARKRNEVTDFGKFMDPLADKILVIAALLVLVELRALPSWVVLIIVAREFIVSGVRMVAANKGEVIAASWYGKFKTVFQMIAIVLFVVKENTVILEWSSSAYGALYALSWLIMAIALVLTIVSMLDYISKARHLIGFKPRKGSAAEQAAAKAQESAVEERVIQKASAKGVTLGTAESCTGGLIAATLTDVPGASAALAGGIVSYANEVKRDRLGVDAQTLEDKGAVSEEVACQMASGARRELSVDVAVSVTGIAGPGGAVPGKPVGTVWIGVSSHLGTSARLHHFDGDRDAVRRRTVEAALGVMLEEIEKI
jgi:nicotinamide-nucleotide amidase